MACIAQAATLENRILFLHFFDGFRTSHEEAKIELLSDDDLRFMMRDDLIQAHRQRSLSPDRPMLRGTTENPDTFFQTREASNSFYLRCPAIIERTMQEFGAHLQRACQRRLPQRFVGRIREDYPEPCGRRYQG